MLDPTRPTRHRGRLYLRIYLAVLAILAAVFVVGMVWWHLHTDPRLFGRALADFSKGLERALPVDLSPAKRQSQLDAWDIRTGADLALYAADGRLLASSTVDAPSPPTGGRESSVPLHAPQRGHHAIGLSNGRVLTLRPRPNAELIPRPTGTAAFFCVLALLTAAGCYPLVRSLTRRLERLQRDVEAWDGTDHLPRVDVAGTDEIAALAQSFNVAAERIETLLRAQKSLLANASHELRSPLTRIRVAIELLPDNTPPELHTEITRNIRELDALVDELLLSSRLDGVGVTALRPVTVELADLARDIAQGATVTTDGGPTTIHGDPRLLTRLLRNLVENAHRHGRGAAVDIVIDRQRDELRLQVLDRGPGLRADDCERVFEPFYRATGASETDGGVGLGLSLVRQIAQLHGGRVACRPREDGGTCFEVWLPR